jgi:hypothetical protein
MIKGRENGGGGGMWEKGGAGKGGARRLAKEGDCKNCANTPALAPCRTFVPFDVIVNL